MKSHRPSVLLKVPLSIFSGYGRDGIGLAQTFLEFGWEVYLQPTFVSSPLPTEVAMLLTKPLVGPFDLGLIHLDPAQLRTSPEMREACDRLIGWTMWEFDSLANMDAKNLSEIDYHFQTFDAILCYDEVTAEAMRPHCPDDLPLLVLQGGYDPEPWGAVERDWFSDRFGFAMCGVLSERKNPFAAIAAFKELKTEYPVEFEGAELHLKDTSGSLHPAIMETIPKLRIHYETWPMDVLKEFYRNQHVLLAPSHGEGKNLPALEFLSTGGTVIASNWGGHAQWLSDEYAYPVPVTLGQMPFHPDVHWANIDMEGLKAAMLSAYRNRDEAKKKGDIAARTIPAMCNWSTVVERLFTIANNLERREVTLIRGMP